MESLDFASIEAEELTFWQEIWSTDLSLYENTKNILGRSVALPYAEIQMPIAAVYPWLNSKWSRELPLLFCIGDSGSGKSTLATFSEKLHDVETQGVNTTAVGCRNYLNELRWPMDDETGENNYDVELDGAILVFDNVYTKTFTDDNGLKGLLLCGHKRGKDAIRIGGGSGKTLKFYTFSPKVISTIEPVYEHHELSELKRRMFVIFHKLWENMDEDEKPVFDWDKVINLDDICWDGFSSRVYHPLFRDQQRARQYIGFKKSYAHCNKPKGFTQNRKPLCADFIATGCLIGAWKTPQEGIEVVGRYWDFLDEKMSKDSNALAQFIRKYCDAADTGEGVKTSELKAFIDLKVGNNQLWAKPRPDEVKSIMHSLGYVENLESWRK